MRWPFGSRWLALLTPLLLLSLYSTAGCSNSGETNTVETSGNGDAPFGVAIEQAYITIENRTGSPIVDRHVEIVPRGGRPPFTVALPRLESNTKRDLQLRDFRGNDGTEFNRGAVRANSVRILATDIVGKRYKVEVPFQ